MPHTTSPRTSTDASAPGSSVADPAVADPSTVDPRTGRRDRPSQGRASARERLLAAADELFYEEGVHIVGIDRVIERAGVAKASLYSAFGSKDELIRQYLMRRHVARRDRIMQALARYDTPRERLLGIFDMLGESFKEPGFHGCAFVNASAEAPPDSPIQEAAAEYRTWLRSLFVGLAREAAAASPERLAQQLMMLYDGAAISARMDRGREAAVCARVAAAALIDQAVSATGDTVSAAS